MSKCVQLFSVMIGLLYGCDKGLSSTSTPPVQEVNKGGDYAFLEGTRWTYSIRRKESKDATLAVTVTKSEKGCTYLSFERRDAAGKVSGSAEEKVWWIGNGGLCIATIVDGRPVDAQILYKLGSKKGDTWDNSLGETTASHEGQEEIKVPAGTYKDAIHIKVASLADKRVIAHYWLVAKVGLVKWAEEPLTVELERFEKP